MSARENACPSFVFALALSLALLFAGLTIGFQADIGADGRGDGSTRPTWWDAFIGVITVNGPAIALLYSGTLTLGLATLIAWPILAIYIGATLRASVNLLGPDRVFGAIWVYAPLEFIAMVLSASAGLLPLLSGLMAALSLRSEQQPIRAYLGSARSTLRILAVAMCLTVTAASIEATVIALNPVLDGGSQQ
ncbi:hypothetical protein [Sinomonas susongensis]|uniref:hypothetical protein n=1 Tax=Sinomonas susongensis TaxID=1324851 RepID=UPI0011087CB7|nr:hypothetical protein [Sinomonas susongensis]